MTMIRCLTLCLAPIVAVAAPLRAQDAPWQQYQGLSAVEVPFANGPIHMAGVPQVWLKLPGVDELPATVAWELDLMIGCKFEVALRPAVFAKIINQTR